MKGKGGNVVVGVLLARVKSWMGAKKVVEEAMEDILSGWEQKTSQVWSFYMEKLLEVNLCLGEWGCV